MKRAFNEKVLELREHKLQLVEKMKQIGERLAEIRCEIPSKMVKQPPAIPQIDEDLEFPEKNLDVSFLFFFLQEVLASSSFDFLNLCNRAGVICRN